MKHGADKTSGFPNAASHVLGGAGVVTKIVE
jgi:hypothetical protein